MKTLLTILFPFILFGYQDLGKEGQTYKIIEKNFLDELEKEVKQIKEEKVKESLIKQVDLQATGENNLSYCKEDKQIKEFDYVILPENIYSPTGKLYQEKGTKVTSYLEQPLDICFVDGSNMIMLENQINFFDKETFGKCVYMISNRNILDVYKKWPERNRMMFPTKKHFEERFDIKCNPTRVHLIHNDRIKYEKSIEFFKNK